MTDPKAPLGSTEIELLLYIGDHHPIKVSEVAEHMAQASGQARTTILTIMERLREKGHLSRKKIRGVYHYSPRVPKGDLLRGLVRSFVKTTLGGAVSPFVAYLAEGGTVSETDLAQLKQLVRDLEDRQGEVHMNALHVAAQQVLDLLWRASWQGGLAVLAVGWVCWLIPQLPARFQAWCWRLALLKCAVVLVWLVPAIEIPVLQAPPVRTVARTTDPVPVPMESVSQPRAAQRSDPNWEVWPTLFFLWCAGACWQLFGLLKQGRQAAVLSAGAQPITEQPIREQYDNLCRAWGVRKPPALRQGKGDGSPFLVGLVRPAIVFPAATLSRLNHAERELVLGHELAHYVRGDLPWGLFAAVVRAVFFFHPAVWLAEQQLRCAQEAAADALTVGFQGGNTVLYAERLVTIVSKLGVAPGAHAFQAAVSGTHASLQQRLFVMRFMTPVSCQQAWVFTLLLGATAVLGIVPWTLVAAEPQPTGKTPTEERAQAQAIAAQQAAKLLIPSLGQKREEVVKLLGEPQETERLASGIESLHFHGEGARTYVEISPTSKQAIQVYYFKKTPFTAEEIKGLLARNAEGATWTQSADDQGSYHYRRSDQGSSRGGARDDEHLFAVLSGSASKK